MYTVKKCNLTIQYTCTFNKSIADALLLGVHAQQELTVVFPCQHVSVCVCVCVFVS